jgi:hypothetical protein
VHIEILTEPLPSAYHWDPRTYFRGTEEFYVRTAECLAALGHKVTVVWSSAHVVEHNGVRYQLNRPIRPDFSIHCNQRQPATRLAPRVLHWTNLWNTPVPHAQGRDLVVPSKFMANAMGRNDATVIPHGVDDFWRVSEKDCEKLKLAVFTSAPDRGEAFLREMWPRVKAQTGMDLFCVYGGMTDEDMRALYADAGLWLHPGGGVELFCLAGYKAQAAACIPVVVPNMALAETVVHKHAVRTTKERFEADLIAAANAPFQYDSPNLPTWADTATLWQQVIDSCY